MLHHQQALEEKYILEGRYEIIRTLGIGGFGITYEAHDGRLNRTVVLKECYVGQIAYRNRDGATVSPTSNKVEGDYEWSLQRFLEEGRVLAKFSHPNILSVQDIFEANNTAYLVTSYIEGQPLSEFIEDGRILPYKELEKILTPLLDALKAAHSQNVLHRDIAKDNILIDKDGKPVLIDFGAARQAIGRHSQSINLIVKDGYSPPEQYSEKAEQGPYTDIYALSALIYQLCSGQLPPAATDRQYNLSNGEDDPLQPLQELVQEAGYPPGLLAAVMAGLSIATKKRPQTVSEFTEIIASKKEYSSTQKKAKPDSDRKNSDLELLEKSLTPVKQPRPSKNKNSDVYKQKRLEEKLTDNFQPKQQQENNTAVIDIIRSFLFFPDKKSQVILTRQFWLSAFFVTFFPIFDMEGYYSSPNVTLMMGLILLWLTYLLRPSSKHSGETILSSVVFLFPLTLLFFTSLYGFFFINFSYAEQTFCSILSAAFLLSSIYLLFSFIFNQRTGFKSLTTIVFISFLLLCIIWFILIYSIFSEIFWGWRYWTLYPFFKCLILPFTYPVWLWRVAVTSFQIIKEK